MSPLVFDQHPRRLRARGFGLMGIGLLLLVGAVGGVLFSGGGTFSLLRMVAVLLLFVGVLQLGRGFVFAIRGQEPGPVELDDAGLLAHRSATARRRERLDYRSIRALLMHRGRKGNRLLIGSTRFSITLDSQQFTDPEAVTHIAMALRERIHHLPEGADRVAHLDAQESLTRALIDRRPTVTYVLLGLIIAGFMLQDRMGAIKDPLQMIRLGAGVPDLVWSGEWYRLISANFLHGVDIHLQVNALALWMLGGLLERMVGPWRMLAIYLVSALGGAAASMVWNAAPLMVGSSTAMYGLLGALLVVDRVYTWQIPPIFRQSAVWWVVIIGVNGMASVGVPQIDAAAHVGGFIAGVGITWWLLPRDRRFRPDDMGGLRARAVALAMSAVFVAGLVQAASAARDFDPTRALEALAAHPRTTPTALNDAAWRTLIKPDASGAALEKALELADAATGAAPTEPGALMRWTLTESQIDRLGQAQLSSFQDTRAGALYRLGRIEEALRQERIAFVRRPEPIYGAHLLTMMKALSEVPLVSARLDGRTVVVSGLDEGPQTLLGRWSASDGEGGFFYARTNTTGAVHRLEAQSPWLMLPLSAEVQVRWVGATLTEEGQATQAGTYQAWPATSVGELP